MRKIDKKQLENANSKEEMQDILDQTRKNAEEAGVILSDEDLELASGGGAYHDIAGKAGIAGKTGKAGKNHGSSTGVGGIKKQNP